VRVNEIGIGGFMSSTERSHVLSGTSLFVLGLALVSCGGGSGTGPSSTIPNLVGNYTGSWVQDLTADGQAVPTVTCPSTLTVPSQTDNIFYGRSTLSAPCAEQGLLAGQGRGGTLSISEGRIEASGAITFRFSEDPPVGISAGGCTIAAMPAFTGSFSGNTVSAQRTEIYDCTAAGAPRYSLTIRLSATRN
jgi:hypothetical protein